jgi:methionyl-tRNA synthetase
VLCSPFIPEAAEKIAGFFGFSILKAGGEKGAGIISWDDLGLVGGLSRVENCSVLFERLDDDKLAALRERYSGTQTERKEAPNGNGNSASPVAEAAPAAPPELPEKRFAATLDLRSAKIVKIERHPKADKLYVETLDIAGEERVIVSGLVPYYKEDELLGRDIIVAYNLAAAKLRGVESRGMLLAASCKGEDAAGSDSAVPGGAEIVEVLDSSGVPSGTRVTIEGFDNAAPAEIDIDTFFSVPIVAEGGVVKVGGKALLLGGKPITTARVKDGKVG